MNLKYIVYTGSDYNDLLCQLRTKGIPMKDIIIVKTGLEIEKVYFFGYTYIETNENFGVLSCINMINKYKNHMLVSSEYYMFLDHKCTLNDDFGKLDCTNYDSVYNQRPCNYIFVIHRNLLSKAPYYKSMNTKEIENLDIGFPVRSMEHILNFSQCPKILNPIVKENDISIYPGLGVNLNSILSIKSEHDSFYKLPSKKYKIKKGKRRKFWKNNDA